MASSNPTTLLQTITAQTPLTELPTDVSLLRQMVLHLLTNMEDLNEQLAWLKRQLFGHKSERFDPAQRLLFAELVSDLQAKMTPASPQSTPSQDPPHKKPRNQTHTGRKALPANLPRERIEYHPEPEALTCGSCGTAKTVMGQEVTEQLEYRPASFVVLQHVRFKYACPRCKEDLSIPELKPFAVDKGKAGTGLLAHVITSKYCDHLPLNRQQAIFRRSGVELEVSTLCDWVGQCTRLLEPIVQAMHQPILRSAKIHTDDTAVPVQGRHKNRTVNGYLWAYIGTDHSVVFDFTPTRSREGPVAFLKKYNGYVQADAYSGYDRLFASGSCIEVACWAHARRKFESALDSDPDRAGMMLALIGELYAVERQAKEQNLEPAQIQALRQQESQPILTRIRNLLDDGSVKVLPKSPLGKAIGYALGQWKALNRYLEAGILSIDNNLSERVLRMVVIGRKNWLFAGSEEGARRAAIVYSLVASCKLCGIDPFAYFRDVLDRVSTHPASRIEELTPPHWQRMREQTAALTGTTDAAPSVVTTPPAVTA
jgi:transposase